MGAVKAIGRGVTSVSKQVVGITGIQWLGQLCVKSYRNTSTSIRTDLERVDDQELAARKAAFERELATWTKAEYVEQMRAWQMSSRVYYGFSALLMALIAVLFNSPLGGAWTLIDGTALSAYLFAKGLRHAYRYWQMQTETFFEEGAFKRWWQQGAWLV